MTVSPVGIYSIYGPSFHDAHPFPHTVCEGVLDRADCLALNQEWPDGSWTGHLHGHSDKRGCQAWDVFGKTTKMVLRQANSPEFVEMLASMSGIADLSTDQQLLGGGLHESFTGGFLGIHADFNIHPVTRLYRRLNLLLYLNEGWQPEWGGALELWDREKTGCQIKIEPIAGRCVIFATSTTSFHGHPEPLSCPPDRSRRSIALYYYSAEPPDEETREHSTLYLGDEANWFAQ